MRVLVHRRESTDSGVDDDQLATHARSEESLRGRVSTRAHARTNTRRRTLPSDTRHEMGTRYSPFSKKRSTTLIVGTAITAPVAGSVGATSSARASPACSELRQRTQPRTAHRSRTHAARCACARGATAVGDARAAPHRLRARSAQRHTRTNDSRWRTMLPSEDADANVSSSIAHRAVTLSRCAFESRRQKRPSTYVSARGSISARRKHALAVRTTY